ncbi:MAG: dihydrodipicolinate synthase family protein [Anaerolineae bacterium]|nr:dihydrodipicolinate synthase family protein [Anaerolineae bacterium]MDH7472434.1 dihydrodipicolinate synthase family protein [Anaerolineae bacterium]
MDTKKTSISLAGVFPPITTPFDPEGNVDYQALVRNLERWNQYELAGYVVLGSNGEAVYLTEEEKLRVLKTARQAIPPNRLLIAGTGCESTRQTITFTRQAAQAGADAALVVTPHYFGGQMTPESLVHYYEAVAEASPIPIMLYNVPKFTHVDMDAATIARAAQHPNIVGLKDSSGNITKLADIVRQTDPTFQVLAGAAGFFFAGLALGAVGGVLALANIAPQQCVDIYRLFKAGRWDEAADLQRRMIPVNAAVTARFGIAGLKSALDMLGYYGGPVRQPLLDLTKNERQTLRDILVKGGLL